LGYTIRNIIPLDTEELNSGVFLCIARAGTVPPHILIFVDGTCFELSFDGPNSWYNLTLIRSFYEKKPPCLFFALKYPQVQVGQELVMLADEMFRKYKAIGEKGCSSCLQPIRDFLSASYALDFSATQFVFELLPLLSDRNLILYNAHMNMENQLQDGTYTLPEYDMSAITNRLHELKMSQIKS
jgi:hypothetical protein